MATRNPKPRRRVVSPLQRPDGSFPAGSRVVIDVRWSKPYAGWVVTWTLGRRLARLVKESIVRAEGAFVPPGPLWCKEYGWLRKPDAVRYATQKARELWAGGAGWDRIPAQVRIYRKDGALQSERTYPDVTPRRAG